MTVQTEFPFASLDFPGRATLKPDEIAERLGVSTQHILDLIEERALKAVDVSGGENKTSRRLCKVPIESYRNFILSRLTGGDERDMLLALPDDALRALYKDIERELNKRGMLIL